MIAALSPVLKNFVQVILVSSFVMSCTAQSSSKTKKNPVFTKHIITRDFVAEGAAVADVNKDGREDIIAGTFWFEAPTWKRHELAPAKTYNPSTEYSDAFLSYALDVNKDGWIDYIRIGYPGKAAIWYENPKNKAGHWATHLIYKSVGNESPAFIDLDGDKTPDLISNDSDNKKVIWLKVPVLPADSSWIATVISNDKNRATHMYTHGLGVGDINGDGRKDILIKDGWWEAPANVFSADWTFHPAVFGKDCAQMYTLDVDGDGDADVISSSAHNYGIWWHEQKKNASGEVSWSTHEISKQFSQTHTLSMQDINGDGHPDLITGKRYYAHNGKDPGAEEPAVLFWFEFVPGKQPKWIPHEVDNDSGAGLNLVTRDINADGKVDIVVANKKGVFFFEQQ